MNGSRRLQREGTGELAEEEIYNEAINTDLNCSMAYSKLKRKINCKNPLIHIDL
jgi:hypothetical protein